MLFSKSVEKTTLAGKTLHVISSPFEKVKEGRAALICLFGRGRGGRSLSISRDVTSFHIVTKTMKWRNLEFSSAL